MKKYLTKAEVQALQKEGLLLTLDQVIAKAQPSFLFALQSASVTVKFADYRGNRMAPEPFAYMLFWRDPYTGKRESSCFWPDSVGLQ